MPGYTSHVDFSAWTESTGFPGRQLHLISLSWNTRVSSDVSCTGDHHSTAGKYRRGAACCGAHGLTRDIRQCSWLFCVLYNYPWGKSNFWTSSFLLHIFFVILTICICLSLLLVQRFSHGYAHFFNGVAIYIFSKKSCLFFFKFNNCKSSRTWKCLWH